MDIHNTVHYQGYRYLQNLDFSSVAIDVAMSACNQTGVSALQLFHNGENETYCRKLTMYMLFEYYGYTIAAITRFFNCARTTVDRAIRDIAFQSKITLHMQMDIDALSPKSK